MEYTKVETMAYNLHFIKTDKFKRVFIKVNFKGKGTKEGITHRNLLTSILANSNKNYPKGRDISLKLEDLYAASFNFKNIGLGTDDALIFYFSTLIDEYSEDGNEEDFIKFISQMIFEPNVKNNKFDKESFKMAKEKLKQGIETKNEDPDNYANIRFNEIFYEGTVNSYSGPGYLEDLENIDEEKLFKEYQKILKTNNLDIFVCGDINVDKYIDLLKKYILVNTVKKPRKNSIILHNKIRKRTEIVKDKRDVKQCILKIGSKFDDISIYERNYIAPLYAYILGGGADSLMFSEIREKNSLCYYCWATFDKINTSLIMKAGINYNNISKTINLIKKLLKDMESGNFDEAKIEQYKIVVKAARKETYDSPTNLIGMYQSREYFNMDLEEEFEQNLEKLNKKMVVEFAKKVKINTIYTLEGDEDKDE